MPFNRYRTANNASGTPVGALSAGTTTLILTTGQGARFPSVYPYLLTIEERQSVSPFAVTKREIVRVTNRVGDTFTIVRSAGTCLPDDTSNTPGTTAFSFPTPAQTIITLADTSEVIDDMQEEISTKLPIIGGLGTGYGTNKAKEIDLVSGNEVLRNVSTGSSIGASELVQFIDPSTRARKEVPFSNIQGALYPSAIIDQQFRAGEALSMGDSVFAEPYSTFAGATVPLNISDVTANTRIFIPIFGSGVAMTTFKLALRKAGTPTQNLNFRIETDNGSGLPTGTLFNANGTATIAQASLTTSFADTTLTLSGSITIPAGQLCHIVLYQGTYGTETINNTNYYQVGVSSNQSDTRDAGWHNGTSYVKKGVSSTGTLTGDAFSQSIASITTSFTALKPFYITSVNVSSVGTAVQPTVTVAQSSRNQSMAQLASGYIANFSSPFLIYPGGFTINLNYGSVQNVRMYSSYSVTSPLFTSSPSNTFSIVGVTGQEELTLPYVSSSGIFSTVISKTSAFLSYKLGSYPTFATQAISRGDIATRAILGEIPVSGVINNTLYYVSDISGAISATAGTNSSKVGKGFSDGTLFIDKYAT